MKSIFIIQIENETQISNINIFESIKKYINPAKLSVWDRSDKSIDKLLN